MRAVETDAGLNVVPIVLATPHPVFPSLPRPKPSVERPDSELVHKVLIRREGLGACWFVLFRVVDPALLPSLGHLLRRRWQSSRPSELTALKRWQGEGLWGWCTTENSGRRRVFYEASDLLSSRSVPGLITKSGPCLSWSRSRHWWPCCSRCTEGWPHRGAPALVLVSGTTKNPISISFADFFSVVEHFTRHIPRVPARQPISFETTMQLSSELAGSNSHPALGCC